MITFHSISIKNFWSFGNKATSVKLDETLTSLIVGDNQDKGDHGISKNGVGKTAIFQAVVYTLFGQGLDRIKQDDFINFTNKKKMECKLYMTVGEHGYEIVRGRKPNKVEVYRNGKEYTRDSVGNTDDLIEEIIGMNYEVFINTCLLYPHTDPFMNMKGSEQRAFMEELLSLNLLTKRAESLKGRAKDIATEIKVEDQRLQMAATNNSKVEEQILQADQKGQQWQNEQDEKVNETCQKIAEVEEELSHKDEHYQRLAIYLRKKVELENIDEEFDNETRLFNERGTLVNEMNRVLDRIEAMDTEPDIIERYQKHSEEINESLDAFAGVDFDTLLDLLGDIETSIKERDNYRETYEVEKQKRNELHKEQDKTQRELDSVDSGTCPFCHQDYHDENHLEELRTKIEDIHKALEGRALAMDTIYDKLTDLDRIISNCQNRIDDMMKTIPARKRPSGRMTTLKQAYDLKHEYERLKSRADSMDEHQQEEIEKAESKEAEYISALYTLLGLNENETTVDQMFDQIEQYLADHKRDKEELESMRSERRKLRDEINQFETEIHAGRLMSEDQIDQKENYLNRMKQEVEAMRQTENPYEGQAERLKEMLQDDDTATLYDLKKTEEHYKILIKLLTDNKSFVRKNIINQYVPFINKQINVYLSQVDSQHIAEINPDLTVDIFYMDQSVSYGNLSRGERLRLNLGTSLAFRDLNAMLGKKTNLLMIDEYLDSALDPAGFTQVFKLIKGYADHTMIISHRDDLVPKVDKIINVVKKNGFTILEGETA